MTAKDTGDKVYLRPHLSLVFPIDKKNHLKLWAFRPIALYYQELIRWLGIHKYQEYIRF